MGSVAGWTIESFPSINTLQQTFTGDGVSGAYIWGAQVETNSYATSYIPTTTAQVTRAADTSTSAQTTRSADVASINTMTPWFSSTQGTLFGQFDTVASGTRTVADINDGTGNESIRLGSVGTDPYFTVTDGGVDQATIDAGSIASSTSYKFAAAYKANDFAACIGGGTVQVDTSGTLPTVNQVLLGTSAASNNLNGHLQRITYYPSKLTNAELQALTA
jgi:hypothetical protein